MKVDEIVLGGKYRGVEGNVLTVTPESESGCIFGDAIGPSGESCGPCLFADEEDGTAHMFVLADFAEWAVERVG